MIPKLTHKEWCNICYGPCMDNGYCSFNNGIASASSDNIKDIVESLEDVNNKRGKLDV